MQQSDDDKEPLARLTFNSVAARDYFGESKGMRLRVERGIVSFRPTRSMRGLDVIAIERRPRSVTVDLPDDKLERRLLQRLFKAGLTEDQPHFAVEPAARGWLKIDHLPDGPVVDGVRRSRFPSVVVSHFDPPLVPIDLSVWNRFRRSIGSGKTVDEQTWRRIYDIVRSAVRLDLQQQRGRISQERLNAKRLLVTIERNLDRFVAWRKRQPEYGGEFANLVRDVNIEIASDEAVPLHRDENGITHVSREFVEQVIRQRDDAPPLMRKKRPVPKKPIPAPYPAQDLEDDVIRQYVDDEAAELPNESEELTGDLAEPEDTDQASEIDDADTTETEPEDMDDTLDGEEQNPEAETEQLRDEPS